MDIETCSFVRASELFNGLDELLQEFVESNPPFSWGDNNRSLVTVGSILDHLGNTCVDENEQAMRELAELSKRVVTALPDKFQTYVDLEN